MLIDCDRARRVASGHRNEGALNVSSVEAGAANPTIRLAADVWDLFPVDVVRVNRDAAYLSGNGNVVLGHSGSIEVGAGDRPREICGRPVDKRSGAGRTAQSHCDDRNRDHAGR